MELIVMRLVCALACIVSIPSIGLSSAIWVPDDHLTIQQAIDAAVNGDEVIVRPGTYFEKITFAGKAITVRSEWGPSVTTIDGNQAGSVVTFPNANPPASLSGFTITRGTGTVYSGPLTVGGGIFVHSSSPMIEECIIAENEAGEDGGGIYCVEGSSATVRRCIIRDNEAHYGGGFYSEGSSPILTDCIVVGNSAIYGAGNGGGGGIACDNDPLGFQPTVQNCLIIGNAAGRAGGGLVCWNSSPRIVSCTFSGNHGGMGGGGISCQDGASPVVSDSILWADTGAMGPEIWLQNSGPSSTLTIDYCDVQGGQASAQLDPGCTLNWGLGMLDLDPLFFDAGNDDYRLRQDPPQSGMANRCVDGGDPSSSPVIMGTTRTDWVQDTWKVDMGYHYPVPSDPGTGFCFGDGSGTPCPCGNTSGVAEGCANSSGSGGLLAAFGSSSVAADELTLGASQLLPGQPGLLFSANNAINGGNGITFGDGLRCAGMNVIRLGARVPDGAGGAYWGPSLGAQGGWGAGDVRFFQVWYRDPSGSPCGFLFNLSSAIEVEFTP